MKAKIDFSILDGISSEAVENAPKPVEKKVYYKLETEEKLKASIEEAAAKQLEVYAAHQDAVRRSGTLRNDITKGIQEGKDPVEMLLKAVECISLMTGDKLFYRVNKENISAVYGT